MKIMFIENRYRTVFWEKMATLLQQDGHNTFFLVENHLFMPELCGSKCFGIPYPPYKKNSGNSQGTIFDTVKMSDRAIRHFGLPDNAHYKYYYDKIDACIMQTGPDVVFGESTAFHELLTIEICKKRGIPYLHPNTCRYPVGRFSFYLYNTLEPVGGCGNGMPYDEAVKVIDSIVNRKIVPDYMQKQKNGFDSKWKRLGEFVTHTRAYCAGERYNTPAPLRKWKLESERKNNIARWEHMVNGRKYTDLHGLKILYPLQMQPEANLDVWGRKYNDQVALLKQILRFTDPSVQIIVKPNPKSKYEMSECLIRLVENERRIIPVKHSTPMADVMSQADMVLTVTGTIAIECILSNKPVATLVNTLNNTSPNCLYLESPEQVRIIVDRIRRNDFPQNTEADNIRFINRLYSSSYPGLPYEKYLSGDNIAACKQAFDNILSHVQKQ